MSLLKYLAIVSWWDYLHTVPLAPHTNLNNINHHFAVNTTEIIKY